MGAMGAEDGYFAPSRVRAQKRLCLPCLPGVLPQVQITCGGTIVVVPRGWVAFVDFLDDWRAQAQGARPHTRHCDGATEGCEMFENSFGPLAMASRCWVALDDFLDNGHAQAHGLNPHSKHCVKSDDGCEVLEGTTIAFCDCGGGAGAPNAEPSLAKELLCDSLGRWAWHRHAEQR